MPLIQKGSDKAIVERAPRLDLATDLSSASPDVRWAAARSAPERADAVPLLSQALAREDNPRVREAIVTSLARIATPEAALALLPLIRSDDAGMRTAVLDGLRAMPNVAEPHLGQLLRDADPDVRLLACDLARDLNGKEVAQQLCNLLETETYPTVCAAAVEALAEIGNALAVPYLEACALRFRDDQFLGFAVEVALERLGTRGTGD